MQLINSIQFEFINKHLEMFFYKYKDFYFRSFYLLRCESDFKNDLIGYRLKFETHEENLKDFFTVLSDKKGKVLTVVYA